MLFLIVSSARPERPSTVTPRSTGLLGGWIEPKLKSGQALFAYPKVGRGVAVAFDVRSHEELHALLNEWAEMIPAEFEVIPLIDPAKAKRYLAKIRIRTRR